MWEGNGQEDGERVVWGASSAAELAHQFQWLIIAAVLAVAVIVAAMVLRPQPGSPAAPATPDYIQQAHEERVACYEGGGTWNNLTACEH